MKMTVYHLLNYLLPCADLLLQIQGMLLSCAMCAFAIEEDILTEAKCSNRNTDEESEDQKDHKEPVH